MAPFAPYFRRPCGVAENRKFSVTLGLTGGELQVETAGYHMLLPTCSSWHNGLTTARAQPRPL